MTIPSSIFEQLHGYKNGHQRLGGNINLAQADQDTVDRLSDISGQLRPGERFEPYFTAYPLPSGTLYVLAVTHQDLEAPRAGCVRTHSLFVPMPAWMERNNLDLLRAILTLLYGPTVGAEWPPVRSSWTMELVEAIFLEERVPIAVFDAKGPDIVAFRLLASLWPSLRGTFSICTFALAPRSLTGRSFDLVFAPNTARSRFSEWSGRRIDVTPAAYTPRHRWSSIIGQAVFEAPRPGLDHLDDLKLLEDSHEADESRLRMALLWRELAIAAKSSPQAVLGLVDVFMTARPVSARARSFLSEAFRSAVLSAGIELSNYDFWEFMIALVEKFKGRALPKGGIGAVRMVVRERAKAAPNDCLSALAHISPKESIPKVLASSIGDGLSASEEALARILERLVGLDSIGAEVVSNSKSLASRLISSIDSESISLSESTYSILARMDVRHRRVLLRRSAGAFHRAEQADILSLLLKKTTRSTFAFALQAIWRGTHFKVAELNSALVDGAKSTDSVPTLQCALLEAPKSEATGLALAETLQLSAEGFGWLRNHVEDDWFRAWIISLLIDSATKSELEMFASTKPACSEALLTLSRDLGRYAPQMMRLLVIPEIGVGDLLLHGLRLAQEFKSTDRSHQRLLSVLVRRLIGHSELATEMSLQNTIETLADISSDWDFVDSLFPGNGPPLATIRAMQAYREGSENLKSRIYRQIDLAMDRVLQVGLYGVSQPALSTLAEIIDISGGWNRTGQTRAAGSVLNACFQSPSLPVGDLVIAAFPVVYAEVEAGNPGFNFLSLLFLDWDHCRTIRRQLVDSYLQSVWPPVGLLICAWRVRDFHKVFQYLRRSHQGRDYLKSIQDDLYSYRGPNKDALIGALGEVVDLERIDYEED